MKIVNGILLLNLLLSLSVQAVVYTDKAIDLTKLSFEELQSRDKVCSVVANKIQKKMNQKYGVEIETSEIMNNMSEPKVTLTHNQVVNIFDKSGKLSKYPGKLGARHNGFLWNCNLEAAEDHAWIEVSVDSNRRLFPYLKGNGDTKATALTLK
jgi:hypothetical protein